MNFVPSEDSEQMVVVDYLMRRAVLFTHVPNGGKRHIKTAARLKRLGVSPGVPDILIFTTPPNRPDAKGAALEMKRRTGGKVSPDQRAWIASLEIEGWETFVAEGAKEAIAKLKDWGY